MKVSVSGNYKIKTVTMSGIPWLDLEKLRVIGGPAVEAMSNHQLKTYRDAFLLFDKDGDGEITINEIRALLASLGYDNETNDIDELMSTFDQDGSGSIEFAEFLAVMSRLLEDEDSEEDLVTIFRILDQDGDGFITKGDLKECCTRVGSHLTPQDLDEMVTEADKDGDGQITYDEFIKILQARS